MARSRIHAQHPARALGADPGARLVEASQNNPQTLPAGTALMKFDFAEIAARIVLLAEWFPKTFFVYERRRKPLKLRIDMDLQTVLDGAITPSELHRALRANP